MALHDGKVKDLPRVDQPSRPKLDLGDRAVSQQYLRIMAVTCDQAKRLANHGMLRKNVGYEADWLTDDSDGTRDWPPRKGMPFLLAKVGQVAFFLEELGRRGRCRVRILNGDVVEWHRKEMMPFPTRAPVMGEWAFLVDVTEEYTRFLGQKGLIVSEKPVKKPTPPARKRRKKVQEKPELAYSIGFPNPKKGQGPIGTFETFFVSEHNVVALAGLLPHEAITPFEVADKQPAPCEELDLLPLIDECILQERLQLLNGFEDEDEGEEELGPGSDSESVGSMDTAEEAEIPALLDLDRRDGENRLAIQSWSGSGFFLRMQAFKVGLLVEVAPTAFPKGPKRIRRYRRFGRVAGLDGDKVRVQLLAQPKEPPLSVECVMLAYGFKRRLLKHAVCSGCDQDTDQDTLLVCENFGVKCACCLHMACAVPEIEEVPITPWRCDHCSSEPKLALTDASGSGLLALQDAPAAAAKAAAAASPSPVPGPADIQPAVTEEAEEAEERPASPIAQVTQSPAKAEDEETAPTEAEEAPAVEARSPSAKDTEKAKAEAEAKATLKATGKAKAKGKAKASWTKKQAAMRRK